MISTLVALLIAHHAVVTPPKFQAPQCEPPAVLLGVADSFHLEAEQIKDGDLYALESIEKSGWLAANVGPGDLLIAVHPPSGVEDDVLLFVFFRGCFLHAAKMPDKVFKVLFDRTRS